MIKHVILITIIILAGMVSSLAHAWKKQYRHRDPQLPGIIHESPCRTVAPGVYDCGTKNKARKEHKRTGQWRVQYRPTKDVTITAQSKAYRENRRKVK